MECDVAYCNSCDREWGHNTWTYTQPTTFPGDNIVTCEANGTPGIDTTPTSTCNHTKK